MFQSILKMKLTESILDVLFPILCEVNKDDEDDDEFEESESQNPSSFAAQVIKTHNLSMFRPHLILS